MLARDPSNERPATEADAPAGHASPEVGFGFTRRAFDPANGTLADAVAAAARAAGPGTAGSGAMNSGGGTPPRLLPVLDGGLLIGRPDLEAEIARYFRARRPAGAEDLPPLTLPGGEPMKYGLARTEELLNAIDRGGLADGAVVLVVGGGATLDVTALAVSLCRARIGLVRMPSTTLSQAEADPAWSGTVNSRGRKDFVTAAPAAQTTVNDLDLLRSLNPRDWRAGLSEAVKAAAWGDAELFAQIERDAEPLARGAAEAGDALWVRTAELHRAFGRPGTEGAAPAAGLYAAHGSAHRRERLSGYTVRHGEAVAIGLAIKADYARAVGLMNTAAHRRLTERLHRLGFDLHHR